MNAPPAELEEPCVASRPWTTFCQALALTFLPFLLLLGCWNAPFLQYDDASHIVENPLVTKSLPLGKILMPPPDETYFPVTLLSYRLDRALFAPAGSGNWAPAVRRMTCLYHGLAAFFLWRLLVSLGFDGLPAFFASLLFAIHPTACETVCWASERKNALAALFGFAALFASARFHGSLWKAVLVPVLFLLAVCSKPSALGLLPVLGLLELFDGGRLLRRQWRRPGLRTLGICAARLAPLAAIALFAVIVNLRGHERTLVPPPGGSAYTAALTDVEVLARYLANVLAPVRLSFVYLVEPSCSVFSLRLLFFGAALAAAVAFSLRFAAHARVALFGWAWFVLALAPSLNFISIPQIMQDRYVYLSIPGLLIVLMETGAGLARRFALRRLRVWAGAYAGACLLLGILRGGVFSDMHALFGDAVAKQPRAAHARYGLALAYAGKMMALQQTCPDGEAKTQALAGLRRAIGEEDRAFVDDCPDAARQTNFTEKALCAGEYSLELNDLAAAERYFKLSAFGPGGLKAFPQIRSEALCDLASLKLYRKQTAEAYALTRKAVEANPPDIRARFMRGCAARALAGTKLPDAETSALLASAREDLQAVPRSSALYGTAQGILKQMRQ